MPFVQDDDVIQKPSAKATDHAFNAGQGEAGVITTSSIQRRKLSLNPVTIDAVVIS
jgi:microcompartment protein CcmK/EutM